MTFDEWWKIEGPLRTAHGWAYAAWQEATKQEREACAQECERWRSECDNGTMQAEGWAAGECAAAIRSRGAKA